MKNWKTSLVGGILILAGVALSCTGNVPVGATVVTMGVGFLMAKDGDVTGGTTPATPEAEKRVETK